MVKFVKETHQYFDGKKELISVTKLLKKHDLSADYSMVPPHILEAASKKGRVVHREIDEWLKKKKLGFTCELKNFIEVYNQERNGVCGKEMSEFIIHNDQIAGTCDLKTYLKNYGHCLIEHKTSKTIDSLGLCWQLSLYEYLIGVNFDALLCFRYISGELMVMNVTEYRISREEIEYLLQCEKEGKIYTPKSITLPKELLQKAYSIGSMLERYETDIKRYAEEMEIIKRSLVDQMKKYSIKTYESGKLRITYIHPNVRAIIDSKMLKEKYPLIAKECCKESQVGESIRVTLKHEDDDKTKGKRQGEFKLGLNSGSRISAAHI